MPLPPILQSITDFLRKGYPEGVPDRDYLPLFALLRRRLSDDEVAALAEELAADSTDDGATQAIHAALEQVLRETPLEADVDRVREQLQAAGWEPPTREPV
jgi:hypothetical protein